MTLPILEDTNQKNSNNYNKIEHARDFVSHPKCYKKALVTFVSGELPSAKMKKSVQFKRNDSDHIAFVSKYANLALQEARAIFDNEVKEKGGNV